MKINNKTILAVSLFPSYVRGNKCIKESPLKLGTSACNYDSLVNSVKQRLDNPDIMSYDAIQCPHSAAEELALHLGTNITEIELKKIVSDACKQASVRNPIGTLEWSEVTGKGDKFDKEYYDGNGEWNEEHQTNQPHPPYYEGQPSNILKRDAQHIDDVYHGYAQSGPIQWPGDAPTSMSNFENCELQSAMCCWVSDRQANDNNGNCHTPYDSRCIDADPADNTEICGVSMKRSIKDGVHVDDGFVIYEKDEEGPTHCHGFAWGKDESEADFRYRANNLFYVSMSDHLHDRGYVRPVQGAPMCACVENMPIVTRSDCTEIHATEFFKFTFSYEPDPTFKVTLYYTEIDYNACSAQTNHDLQSFMERLLNEGRVTREKYEKFRQTIRGNGNCPSGTKDLLFEQGYTYSSLSSEDFVEIGGGDCLDRNHNIQDDGEIILMEGDFTLYPENKTNCLEMCSSVSESVRVTGCEIGAEGCYVHTQPIFSSKGGTINYGPPLVHKGSNPSITLDRCEGDCDTDSDCDDGMFCFQRSGHTMVPGCSSGGAGDVNNMDYCVPYGGPSLVYKGSNPSFILGQCEGDCDSSGGCGEGMFCYQRSGFAKVPFCGSGGAGDVNGADYCVKVPHSGKTCWLATRSTALAPDEFRNDNGYCLDPNGHDQNSGLIKIGNDHDYGPSEDKIQECFNLCRKSSYAGKITACEAIWQLSNRGCYIHTKPVFKGNGATRHKCSVPAPITFKREDFRPEQGSCLDYDGNNQNGGKFHIANGNFNTEIGKLDCLDKCLSYSSEHVKGCQAEASRCYVYTREVSYGNGDNSKTCFVPGH